MSEKLFRLTRKKHKGIITYSWIEEYCRQELADETIKNYEKRIRNHIKPALGQYAVSSLSTHVIQCFINEMAKAQYSRNTISSVKGIISKSLKYAKGMKGVARNEALEVELPSWNASRKLRSKLRVPEENGKEVQMVAVRCDGSYIQPRVMQHCSKVIHQELGCPAFAFHSPRHTYATEFEEAGVSSKETQRRLGHKSEATTRRANVHATEEMRIQSVEILNTMYG